MLRTGVGPVRAAMSFAPRDGAWGRTPRPARFRPGAGVHSEYELAARAERLGN